MNRPWLAFLFLALMPSAHAANIDKSDLNSDGVINNLDVEIFSGRYLGQDWQTVDWCAFYETSITNPKYFRSITSDKVEHYSLLLTFIAETNNCGVIVSTSDKSDLNADGTVDLDDLVIFSTNYLQSYWEAVDWCLFHGSVLAGAEFEGRSTAYYLRHFTQLLVFINTYFECGGVEPPTNGLALENAPKFLLRVTDATAITGNYYVTDPRVGSLFIYNEFMVLTGEIKGLNKPLGVAVNAQGHILIGNNGRDNIEVYDPTNGALLATFGEGLVKMPTAITLDIAGNIYVADSRSDRIHKFDSSYYAIGSIGKSGVGDDTLTFPMDVEIIGAEIFVADQGGYRVQVYDLDGNWLRSISFEGTPGQNCNWFTGVCEIPGMPPFTRLQALAKDSLGQLHVLDSFAASVMIFDPADGEFLNAYGGYGTTAGLLRVPMDVEVSATDMAIVTTGDGDRIEIFATP